MKNGQDIIGAADEGFEIVIRTNPGYSDTYMVRIGTTGSFQFDKTGGNHIRHVTFQPVGHNNRTTVETIVFAKCYNRELIIENNLFNIPIYGAALILDCKESLDASVNVRRRPGPGLRFAKNTIIGKAIRTWCCVFLPKAGIIVNLHTIVNQSQRIAVIENSFQGEMADAGDFTLGFGSSMDIFRNKVDINNNIGKTRAEEASGRDVPKEGFSLIGHTSGSEEPPLFNLAGNRIRSKNIAIGVEKRIKLALACNHLQAANPWRQPQRQYSLEAVDPLPLAGECERTVGSTSAMVTPTSPTLCQIVNTWTSITGSMINPLSGLDNLDGQLFFDESVCPSVTTPFVAPDGTSSEAGEASTVSTASSTTAVMTGLGVITTLAILLAR
ncbi:hypothetical protein [Endozoicomonas sp. 4G]|uniref:hypothetical protein n=1 Tax=Endozoicomonas sp. 4G TaxID=2872754 RepID=UPI002078BE00|nr:hypothetical protein [Endozoicomonas sp. 4G]